MGRRADNPSTVRTTDMIEAARVFAGDAGANPISAEEDAVVKRVRTETGRPSKREINQLARRRHLSGDCADPRRQLPPPPPAEAGPG